jgi:hypothetical protein
MTFFQSNFDNFLIKFMTLFQLNFDNFLIKFYDFFLIFSSKRELNSINSQDSNMKL